MIKEEVKKTLKRSDGVNGFEITRDNNCKLLFTILGSDTWGFTVTNNRCHTIVINENLPEYIQEFVCLHELGHVKLHRGFSTPFFKRMASYSVVPKIEKEANKFALEILKKKIEDYEELSNCEIISYLGLPEELIRFL